MTGPDDPYDDFSTLFEFLPIGAYRSTPEGRQLRANPALVRLNGFGSEAEQISDVQDIAREWYVLPTRRDEFKALLDRDGRVIAFESEIHRHKTRERIWVSEHAHVVRDVQGQVRYYEGTVEEITERVQAREQQQRSQQRLQQLVELVPGVVYRVLVCPDGSLRPDYVSSKVESIFGVPLAEARLDPYSLRRLRHPDDRARVDAALAASVREARALDIEYRIVLDDGRERWLHQANSFGPPEGGYRVSVGLMLDITERKQAELALRENSELWKRALESTGDGMWDWNLATGEEVLSTQCLALYGYRREELPAGPEALDDLTHPDDQPQMAIDRAAHLAGQTPAYVNEHRVRCKDGDYKWILSRGVVISRAADGTPLRVIGTHTDITERKQAQALRHERDRAAAADLTKSQFLSRVSHELRTPLNAVLGFAQLLELEPDVSERQRGWVRQVLSSGRHLLALVDDLLDLSSLQTGQLPLLPQPAALHAAVRQACSMLAAAAQDAQVSLHDTVPADATLVVRADRKRLMQILSNLLSNAIKYNRPGGWVRIAAQRLDEQIEMSVSDSGPGIAPEQLSRLFQPFERLGAAHGAVAGTGLGLTLSREFAQAMGGSLEVHSQPGQGATFCLRLPASNP